MITLVLRLSFRSVIVFQFFISRLRKLGLRQLSCSDDAEIVDGDGYSVCADRWLVSVLMLRVLALMLLDEAMLATLLPMLMEASFR